MKQKSTHNTLLRQLPDFLYIVRLLLSKHLGRVDIGRRVQVRVHQHRIYTHNHRLHGQDGVPFLVQSLLRVHGVLEGWVQDRYADVAVGVDYITWCVLFGWNISLLKVILGGMLGNS